MNKFKVTQLLFCCFFEHREARRRRETYERKKSIKLLKLERPQPRVKLTEDQIVHIKLLHEENPREWNKPALASALNVDIDVNLTTHSVPIIV